MRPADNPPSVDSSGGMLVKQWYVDVFYEDVEGLPSPRGVEFEAAMEKIESSAEAFMSAAFEQLRVVLATVGVVLVVSER